MYRIETTGAKNRPRVYSRDRLTADDFRRIADELGVRPVTARKSLGIKARKATVPEHVASYWNGKETEAVAAPGDWIVTALDSTGIPLRDGDGRTNRYVIAAARFAELYKPSFGSDYHDEGVFTPTGTVEAIRVTGGFEIMAPWGEVQRAVDGWLLLSGDDVYGNHRDTFAATYQFQD
jgi:hypothetical protein